MNHSNNPSFLARGGGNLGGSRTPSSNLWNFAPQAPHPGLHQVNLSRSEEQSPTVNCPHLFDQSTAIADSHPPLTTSERREQRQSFERQPQVSGMTRIDDYERKESSYLMGQSSARPFPIYVPPPAPISIPSAAGAAGGARSRGERRQSLESSTLPTYVPLDIPAYVPPPRLPNLGRGSQVNKTQPMILDSGCGPSSVMRPCLTPAFTPYGDPTTIDIRTANSVDAVVCVRGDIRLVCQGVSGRQVSLNLPNSLVSEGFSQNLVCLRGLILDGWKAEWFPDYALLHNPERTDAILLECQEGMYIFPPMNARADSKSSRPTRTPSVKSSTSRGVEPSAAMGGHSEEVKGRATRSSSRIKFDSPEMSASPPMPLAWKHHRAQEEAICEEARNPAMSKTGESPRTSPRTRSESNSDFGSRDTSSVVKPPTKGPTTRSSLPLSSPSLAPLFDSSNPAPLTEDEWDVIKACQPSSSISNSNEKDVVCAPLSAEDFEVIKAVHPKSSPSSSASRYPSRERTKPVFLHSGERPAPVMEESEFSAPYPTRAGSPPLSPAEVSAIQGKTHATSSSGPKTKAPRPSKMPPLYDSDSDSDAPLPEECDWEWNDMRGPRRTMPTPQEGKSMLRKAAAESRAKSTSPVSSPVVKPISEPYPALTMPAKTGSRADMRDVDEPANISEALDRIDELHVKHFHAGQARLALIIKAMHPSENPPASACYTSGHSFESAQSAFTEICRGRTKRRLTLRLRGSNAKLEKCSASTGPAPTKRRA